NNAALSDFDLGDLRHIGPEHVLEGDSTTGPFRQRLAPSRLLGSKLKNSLGARRLVEEGPTKGDRILLGGGRKLVHKAFRHKDIVRRTDAAPERRRNAWWFHAHKLNMEVRQVVGQIDRAFDRVRVEPVLESRRQPPRQDGRSCKTIDPGNRFSLFVETTG